MRFTPEILAAALTQAPLLALVATGEHETNTALAKALGRDLSNLGKSLKVSREAGWIEPDGLVLTGGGHGVLAALDRANSFGADPASATDVEGLREISLDLIDDDPDLNPRKKKLGEAAIQADAAKLAELTASIRQKGVLQPVLVRQGVTEGRFRIVAGSRRIRAAAAAGETQIPALYRVMTDGQAHEAATVENVQRDDMTPMEEARAFSRIVADRMAEDPDLKLKEAKEVIAGVLDKTVRYVELRIELLKLPAAKQDEVEDETLSVTDARKWLRARPKPLSLTPRQWLIALELFDAQERRPVEGAPTLYGAATMVRAEAADDTDLDALMDPPAAMVSGVREIDDAEGVRTGTFCVRLYEHRLDALRMKFGAVDHDETRDNALAEAREALFGRGAMAPGYCTPWLNGPFEPTAEVLAEIAAERAQEQARRDSRTTIEAEAKARIEAEAVAGLGRLGSVLKLGERLDKTQRKPLDPLFAAVFEASGKPLPLYPTPLAGLVCANGARILHDYPEHSPPQPDTVARITLLALAINAAAGLATPQAPPAEDEDPPLAQELDVGEVLPDEDETPEPEPAEEDEAEDTPALEDAGAAEFSPALLKLVGIKTPTPAHP